MERLVDPLTTIDAKLWADEFMKVKARLGEQEFDHAMMLGWFANAIMQGYDEGQRRAKADAQATVEALQAQVVTLKRHAGLDCGDQSCLYALEHSGMRTNGGCQCSPKRMKDDLGRSRKAVEALQWELESANALLHKKNCAIGKAETTIEALQRERDEEQQRLRVVCQQRNDAMTALDAEREKVANLDAMYRQQLGDRDKRIEAIAGSAKIWMKRYTQLQALVRALQDQLATIEKDLAPINLGTMTSDDMKMFDKTKALVMQTVIARLMRTLDATAPAGQRLTPNEATE